MPGKAAKPRSKAGPRKKQAGARRIPRSTASTTKPGFVRATIAELADALAGEPRTSIRQAAQRAFDIAHELRHRPVGQSRRDELCRELTTGIATLLRYSAVEGCGAFRGVEEKYRTREIKTRYVLDPILIYARAHVAEDAAKSADWGQVQERMGDILEWCEKGNSVLRALPPLPDRENVLRAVGRKVATLASPSGAEQRTRKGGRPALRDGLDEERMVKAWGSGQYRTMKECAAALGGTTTCHDIRRAWDRVRKRAARKDGAVK